MKNIKRSLCVLLSALMVVTSLDLSGVTAIRAHAEELGAGDSEIVTEIGDINSEYEDILSDSDTEGEVIIPEESTVNEAPESNTEDEDGDSSLADGTVYPDGTTTEIIDNPGEEDTESDTEVTGFNTDAAVSNEEGFGIVDASEFIIQHGGLLPKPHTYEPSYHAEGGEVQVPVYAATESERKAALEVMHQAAINLQASVDVSRYNIPLSESTDFFVEFLNTYPDLFYVGRRYGRSYSGSTLARLYLYYEDHNENALSASDIRIMQGEFNAKIDEFRDGLKTEWCDLEKMLYINSFIDKNCLYDPGLSYSSIPMNVNCYNAYGCLVDGVAVCNGYALAVNYLCEVAGVPSAMVTSNNLNHAWNLVKIDGKVYHIDTTWNDPTNDLLGRARHYYFLKSGSVFMGHHVKNSYDWVTQTGWNLNDATSTKYDTYFWNSVETGTVYGGNHTWYMFVINDGLYKYTCNASTRELTKGEMVTAYDTYQSDGFTWYYSYTGVGEYDGIIYYNYHDKIYSYDPVTKTKTVVYTLTPTELNNGRIMGMTVAGKTIKFFVGTSSSPEPLYSVNTIRISGKTDIRFDGNGATGGSMAKQTVNGTATLNTCTFTRDGYAFEGWNTKADGTGTSYADGASITPDDDMVLYATWRKIKKILFDVNGGDELEVSFKECFSGIPVGELPSATRTGYTFLGWYTAKTGGTLVTSSTVFSNDITVYARWEAKSITVTFNTNCAPFDYNISFESETYVYDKAFSKLPVVVCSGAAFLGWYTQATGGEKIETSSLVRMSEDSTLYAHWNLGSGAEPYNDTLSNAINYRVANGCVTIISFTTAATGAISIPATIDGYPVNVIAADAMVVSKNITSVSIPESVGIIENGAFAVRGGKLSQITVASGNPFYTAVGGVLFNKNQTKLISIPAAKTGTYTVPATVIEIAERALEGSTLSAFSVVNSVTDIHESNFKYFEAPVSVSAGNTKYTSIDGALYNKEITELLYAPKTFVRLSDIPASVTKIGNYAFYYGYVTNISIPDTITEIGNYAFTNNPASAAVIPASVRKIGDYAFSDCSFLTDIYFAHNKSNTITIGSGAFSLDGGNLSTVVCVPRADNMNAAISGYDWINRNVTYESDEYSLTYVLNGGTNNPSNPSSYTRYGDRRLYSPEKYGYDFAGWYINSDFTGVSYSTIPLRANTLYAKWEPKTCVVTLNPNGGSVAVASVNVKYETVYGELPIPVRNNYAFLGWFDGTSDSANLIYDGVTPSAVINTSLDAHTLYAHWEIKYTVSDPEFSIASGAELAKGARVRLSTITEGAVIYYTLDGTDPVEGESLVYSDEIVITDDVTIKAKAFLEDYHASGIVTASYTVMEGSWEDLGTNSDDLDEIRQEVADNNPEITRPEDVKAEDVPNELWVAGLKNYTYTGVALTQPDMKVYWGTRLLTLNTDYTVKYTNNIKAGTATAVITGKGNFVGTISADYEISPLNIADAKAADIKLIFNKNVQKGVPVLTYELDGKLLTLKNNMDYTVTYPCTDSKDKVNYDAQAFKAANTSDYYPGGYEIVITGKGNYAGTKTIHEFIYVNAVNVTSLLYTLKNTPFDGGNECMPGTGSVIKRGTKILEWGSDKDIMKASNATEAESLINAATPETPYSLVAFFENNTDVGTAKVTFMGIPAKGLAGTVTKTFNITGTALSTVTFSPDLTKTYAWERESADSAIGREIKPLIADGENSSLTLVKNRVKLANLRGIEAGTYEALIAAGRISDTRGFDYTYEYKGDVRNAGSVSIVFKGINGYTGSVTKTYKISAAAIGGLGVRGISASYVYSGEAITVNDSLQVFVAATKTAPEKVLTENVDYTVTYANNTNVGTATVTITGINGYTGTIRKTFRITAYKLTESSISLKNGDYLGNFKYEKGGTKPAVTIIDFQNGREYTLVAGKDYTLTYTANNAVNDLSNPKVVPTVKVTGKGNYTGTISCVFGIERTDISEGLWGGTSQAQDFVFRNSANVCNPTVTLTDTNGTKLVAGVDYIVPKIADGKVYYARGCEVTQIVNRQTKVELRSEGEPVDKADIVPVGAILKAVVETVPKTTCNYNGSLNVYYRVIAANISTATVKIGNQTYTGKPVMLTKDDITVTIGKTVLGKTDYEIVSYENNINKGTAKVTIKGVGNYGGTKTVTYNIAAKTMNYTISYDSNNEYMAATVPYAPNATGIMKDSNTASKAKLTGNSYKRNYYTFAGWNTKPDGTGASYTNAEIFKIKEGMKLYGTSVKLYAQWTPVDYKITYNLSGGTTTNPATYNIESDTIILSDPVRDGATFEGWFMDSAFRKPLNEITAHSNGAKTFYAKWYVHKYNIVFDKNSDEATGIMRDMVNKTCGTRFALTGNAYRRTYYNFTGWNTRADGTGTYYRNAEAVTNLSVIDGDTVTLYAQWTPVEYKITYVLNGGTNVPENPASYNVETESFTLTDLTREGYTFDGWYTDSRFTKPAEEITKGSTGVRTFYAKWIVHKYSVHFDQNAADATGTMKDVPEKAYGASFALPANAFKRNGYSFVGWNTKADGSGTAFKNSQSVKNLATGNGDTVVLYAIWNKLTYTITYANISGVTSNNSPKTYTVTDEVIFDVTPVRPGYDFGGWYTTSSFTEASKVTGFPAGTFGNKTVYAKWLKIVLPAVTYSEEQIWDYLYARIGNEYGVAGLMGNLKAESAYKFNNLQNSYETKLGFTDITYTEAVDNGTYNLFVKDAAGYGLAQWTNSSRKQGLLELARSRGTSISDAVTQLDYLMMELNGKYKGVLNLLIEATSVYDASTNVLIGFEKPADQSDSAKQRRATMGQAVYEKFVPSQALFRVRITSDIPLRVRSGPGTNYTQITTVSYNEVYDIIETSSGQGSTLGWGKLRTGGWISLDYCVRI